MSKGIKPQLSMHLPNLLEWNESTPLTESRSADDVSAGSSADRTASEVIVRAFDGTDSDRTAWERIIQDSFETRVSFREAMELDPAFRPARVLFAVVDGKPAATASAWYRSQWGARTGYLHMVGTLPGYGGWGLGRTVCAAALRQMLAENRYDCVLETDDFRVPAIKLYLSMGFRPRLIVESQIDRWRAVLAKIDAAERWPDAPAFLTHALWPADQSTVTTLEARVHTIDDEPTKAILMDEIEILRRLRDGHPAAGGSRPAALPSAVPPPGAVRTDTAATLNCIAPDVELLVRSARAAELDAIARSLIEQVDRAERRCGRTRSPAAPQFARSGESASPAPAAPTVLDVRDFGAVGDNRHDDGPAFAAALAALAALATAGLERNAGSTAGPTGERTGATGRPPGADTSPRARLRIPAGRYRIDTPCRRDSRAALWVDGLIGATIDGDGPLASIVVGTMVGSILRMENCSDTTIRGIGFDLDPLPFTQGTVAAVDPGAQTIDWTASPGWPGAPNWLPDHPFDPSVDLAFGGGVGRAPHTGRVLGGKQFPIKRIEAIDEQRARLSLRVPWFRDSLPFPGVEAGDTMTLHSRNIPGAQAALWLSANEHCELCDVGVWASWHHAVVVADNSDMRFIDCRIEPMPNTDRLAVSNADGFHVRNNRIGPAFYGCTVRGTADDTSNLYSKAASVLVQKDERRIVVDVPSRPEYRATDWQTDPRSFREGDLVGLVHATDGTIDALATITAVEETWWRGVPRLAIVLSTRLPRLLTRERLGKRHPVSNNMEFFRVSADEQIEHMLVNLAVKSDAFVLRNNRFGENHINTMKLKASNGLIEGNTFDRPTAVGISLCMRLTWQEAFAPRNVVIRNNTFRGCSGIEATIDYPGDRRSHGPAYIDGIEIVDNQFEDLSGFGLRLANVNGMRVVGNSFAWVGREGGVRKGGGARTAGGATERTTSRGSAGFDGSAASNGTPPSAARAPQGAFSVLQSSCRIDFAGNTLNERALTPADLAGGELQPSTGSAGERRGSREPTDARGTDTRGPSDADSGADTFSIGREVSR